MSQVTGTKGSDVTSFAAAERYESKYTGSVGCKSSAYQYGCHDLSR